MGLQILEISVYGAGGVRRVAFEKKQLNIVTGRSQRGKSTLLEIVDYCLLSRSCRIPQGAVRDAIDAVGLLLENNGRRLGIIRRLPEQGNQTRSACWFGQEVTELPNTLPEDNQSRETAKEELSGFTRIEAVDVLTNERSDENSVVSIRHCAPFLFQHQDVIANRNLSFAGLDDYWLRRHVVEGIGYFLGAISIEVLQSRSRLLQLKAQLTSEQRRAAEHRKLSAVGYARGRALWLEARGLSMVSHDTPSALTRLRDGLERLTSWSSGPPLPDLATQLEELEARERVLLRDLDSHRRERDSTKRYLRLSQDTATLARNSMQRISVRSLLPQPSESECPVCGGALPHPEWDRQLSLAEESLQQEATIDPRVGSRLERLLVRVERQHAETSSQLRDIQVQIANLRRIIAARQTEGERDSERFRLVGRIQEYLRALAGTFATADTDTSSLVREIASLEREVGDAAMRERLLAVEKRVSKMATHYASELKTEFGDSRVKFDLRDLSIRVQVDGRWTRLSELGSGANWVSYHVACTLGLHEAFQAGGGPAPQFLMLDQPSQAWFPPEKIVLERGLEPQADNERQAVRNLYEVLNDYCKKRRIQIIVVDHARPDLPWVDACISHDWHGNEGLVPTDWIDSSTRELVPE